MPWEWVAPVVTGTSAAIGVGFTWLAGAQSRIHTENMVEQNRQAEERARLFKERSRAGLHRGAQAVPWQGRIDSGPN